MDKIGFIEIRITGSNGNFELSPDNYDIREIRDILENAEKLLYPSDSRDRPTISYEIRDGSVKHLFKTGVQVIIACNAIIGQIDQGKSIDFMEGRAAKAIEAIQKNAIKNNYCFTMRTSLENTHELIIDKETKLYRTKAIWVDAEFYFYGKITDAGGKDKANIHLVTEERGTIIVKTPINFLEQYSDNLLYKKFGIRATGKQHSETGEVDTSTLQFIELVDYQPIYDEQYLKSLRNKAKASWLGNINADDWLKEIRGSYVV